MVDTSVWIEFFKQRSATGDRLQALILDAAAWTCGVVLFELVQGVRSDAEKSKVLSALSELRYVEMSKSLWQRAGELYTSLRKMGLTIPLSDTLLAVTAIDQSLPVFTLDEHFKQIPGITLYPVT